MFDEIILASYVAGEINETEMRVYRALYGEVVSEATAFVRAVGNQPAIRQRYIDGSI